MAAIITVAKKEFKDLISSGMVVLVLSIYLIYLLLTIIRFNDLLSTGKLFDAFNSYFDQVNFGILCAQYAFFMLKDYGAIIGVMIGCTVISSEIHTKAINTLIVKPLFRDSIINGKLLGSLSFIVLIMAFTGVLFTAALLVICGNAFTIVLWDYLERSILVFGILTIYVSIFLVLSMLISLVVNNQAFSFIMGLIMIFIFKSMITTSFAGNISLLFTAGDVEREIVSYSPTGLLTLMDYYLFNPTLSTFDVFQNIESYLFRLLLFLIIPLVLSYIVFLKRDLA